MDPADLGPGTVTWLGGTGTVLLGALDLTGATELSASKKRPAR